MIIIPGVEKPKSFSNFSRARKFAKKEGHSEVHEIVGNYKGAGTRVFTHAV